jgi:hypothetical protein
MQCTLCIPLDHRITMPPAWNELDNMQTPFLFGCPFFLTCFIMINDTYIVFVQCTLYNTMYRHLVREF